MIAIFDRYTECLPVPELLHAVLRCSCLKPDEKMLISRMGGAGEGVWELESQLDAGEKVFASIDELLQILSKEGQAIDELCCSSGSVTFGVFDATFLFIDAVDKSIEHTIAGQFQVVRGV